MRREGNLSDLYLDGSQRGVEPRAGQIGFVRAFADPASIDTERRRIRFVCSTRSIDRFGEIVEPQAFAASLEAFKANPVALAAHIHAAPDGKPTTIGHWVDLRITQDGLEGVLEFLADDELAELYWRRYSRGVQRAVSVGFIVRAWKMEEVEIDGQRQLVRVFTEVELVEISCVAVPANREALIREASMLAGAASGGDGGTTSGVEELSRAIEPALKRILDASPGGYMCALIEEAVRRALSRAGFEAPGRYDRFLSDDGDEPGPSGALEGDPDIEPLTASIRAQLEAADADGAA